MCVSAAILRYVAHMRSSICVYLIINEHYTHNNINHWRSSAEEFSHSKCKIVRSFIASGVCVCVCAWLAGVRTHLEFVQCINRMHANNYHYHYHLSNLNTDHSKSRKVNMLNGIISNPNKHSIPIYQANACSNVPTKQNIQI